VSCRRRSSAACLGFHRRSYRGAHLRAATTQTEQSSGGPGNDVDRYLVASRSEYPKRVLDRFVDRIAFSFDVIHLRRFSALDSS
jgi:hypothetical protein